MSQCVPSWDVDDHSPSAAARLSFRSQSNSTTAPDVPMLDYEVAELTWENGQIAMHGLGPPRVPVKHLSTVTTNSSASKYSWEKPPPGGTLEAIVNQATRLPLPKPPFHDTGGGAATDELVPWFDQYRAAAAAGAAADAMVPCAKGTNNNNNNNNKNNSVDHAAAATIDTGPGGLGTCVVGSSTGVRSRGGAATQDENAVIPEKRARVARVAVAPEWSSRTDPSVSISVSGTFGRDTVDTCERDVGVDFTSTSHGSPENTSSGVPCTKATTADDHHSVCHSIAPREAGDEEDKKKGTGKSSASTKRSRAAAIHNQSERTDKASMLDEVIEYLKQLQAQVQMMSRINMPAVMMPMAVQQQLQMTNIPAGISPVLHPAAAAFMPMTTSWDGPSDRLQGTVAPPMTMDAYSRMAAMYQQLHQVPPASSSKS
ncbi:hypothetical protein FEM48_Zijuj08G0058300 [Ziziphus jujuba var. spinosa]|uniref:Transcription factor UNE10 n=1 Tax=Ziziphus jujuba var. spinosa TaxID=714518 RepID=A0A978UXC2_ZIZJJ|nr:hypothetical protein FEM48_Zijuj08G0058300 [Ziziphus jujuba var. spinosa]